MSVLTSAIPAAWNYLVAAATAAYPNAQVCDGPMVVVDQEEYADRVTIGWDGDPDAYTPSVTGDQNFIALDRTVSRDENFAIVCSVTHWDGDNSMATARTNAFALLATFEKLVRGYPPNGTGDTSLGGAVQYSEIGGGMQVLPAFTEDGAALAIVFHVQCRARLTGT